MAMGQHITWTLFLMAVVSVTVTAEVPLINAPWGKVEGINVEGDEGRRMNAYLAIPYAEPPVGKLRFERPQPHPGPGEGKVFKADQPMIACPQIKMLIGESRDTSEDCLKLDVYVPATGDADPARPYAVMIFIHGGGFSVGDAYTYRPSRLVVDGRVIVVVIQYRLGVFGFLTSGDDLLPGNQALWDQNMAIRWVSDNIAAFGGDPGRITLFGESAGSYSVGIHMMSPSSQGLFHRGILQSGAPQGVSNFFGLFDEKAVFREVGELFQCPQDSKEALLACLKDQPGEEFFNKSLEYARTSPLQTYYMPRIDGEFIPADPVELTQDEQYMKENGLDKLDVIIGVNNKEGALVLNFASSFGMSVDDMYTESFFSGMIDQCLFIRKLRKNAIIRNTVEFYYRGADFGQNVSKSLDSLVDMFGDCMLTMDILRWAEVLAASCHSGARKLYVLDHNFAYNNAGPAPGSHHGDELVLEFDNTMFTPEETIFARLNKSKMAEEELPLADKFIQILTTFAKTGDPSPAVHEDLAGEDWPEFTSQTQTYLSLAPKSRLVPHMGPYPDRLALWTTFLPDLNTTTADMPEVTPPQPPQASPEESPTREEL